MILLDATNIIDSFFVDAQFSFFLGIGIVIAVASWAFHKKFDQWELGAYLIAALAICFMGSWYSESWILLAALGSTGVLSVKYFISFGVSKIEVYGIVGGSGIFMVYRLLGLA